MAENDSKTKISFTNDAFDFDVDTGMYVICIFTIFFKNRNFSSTYTEITTFKNFVKTHTQ